MPEKKPSEREEPNPLLRVTEGLPRVRPATRTVEVFIEHIPTPAPATRTIEVLLGPVEEHPPRTVNAPELIHVYRAGRLLASLDHRPGEGLTIGSAIDRAFALIRAGDGDLSLWLGNRVVAIIEEGSGEGRRVTPFLEDDQRGDD